MRHFSRRASLAHAFVALTMLATAPAAAQQAGDYIPYWPAGSPTPLYLKDAQPGFIPAPTVDTDTFFTINPDGTTVQPDGTVGPTVAIGPHTTDTDTFFVANPDGTTVQADGSAGPTFAVGPHTIDTDTFFTINPDGTTVQPDGTAGPTVAIGPHTVDMVTTSALVDNGDGSFTHTDGAGGAPVTIPRDDNQLVISDDVTGFLTNTPLIGAAGNIRLDLVYPAAISTDPDNSLTVGLDGRFYAEPSVVPWVDSGDGCTPAPLTIGSRAITITPDGDGWEWDGVAWDLKWVNPGHKVLAINQYTFGANSGTLDEAVLAGLIGGGDVVQATASRTIRNNDCVPHVYEAFLRTVVGFDNGSEASRLTWQLSGNSGGTWVGAPIAKASGVIDMADYLRTDVHGVIAVGTAVTLDGSIAVEVFAIDPTGTTSASWATLTGRAYIRRVHPDFAGNGF